MEWVKRVEEFSHFILLAILLFEGIFAYFRIREERKRKEAEKNSQHVTGIWHNDLLTQINGLRHFGDLINFERDKKTLTSTLKTKIENLTHIQYCLSLFSTDNPLEMDQALAYFKDRLDPTYRVILELFKIKLKNFKDARYKTIKKKTETMLSSVSEVESQVKHPRHTSQ